MNPDPLQGQYQSTSPKQSSGQRRDPVIVGMIVGAVGGLAAAAALNFFPVLSSAMSGEVDVQNARLVAGFTFAGMVCWGIPLTFFGGVVGSFIGLLSRK